MYNTYVYIYMPSSTYPPRKACAASARVLSSWMPAWLRNDTIVACNCHIHTCDICYHHHTQLHGIFILFPHMMESRVQTQSASIATCEVHTSKFTHPLDVSQIQRHAREAVPPKQIASFFYNMWMQFHIIPASTAWLPTPDLQEQIKTRQDGITAHRRQPDRTVRVWEDTGGWEICIHFLKWTRSGGSW